jgi:hypothetical protein
VLLTGGLALLAWLTPGPRRVGGVGFDLHSLLLGCLCLVLGCQTLWLWAFAGLHSWSVGLAPGERPPIGWFRHLTLERGVTLGAVVFLAGLALNGWVCWQWWEAELGPLAIQMTLRPALWGSALMILGMQTVSGSFFLSLLSWQKPAGAECRSDAE